MFPFNSFPPDNAWHPGKPAPRCRKKTRFSGASNTVLPNNSISCGRILPRSQLDALKHPKEPHRPKSGESEGRFIHPELMVALLVTEGGRSSSALRQTGVKLSSGRGNDLFIWYERLFPASKL